ncbi:hypothetical protein EXIGLDRAFT_843544 [Exidia glandulosa HHB12029]|uniref:Uncharacterized protein n=1 Tax=Exidia glandulosa HHB12029 TaxID=1314781 RepID=A0A165CK65_EXIGL|nr:hypothetical protein EXIGLDRAFT_843544 [Exidia glandulosa HHB12029]
MFPAARSRHRGGCHEAAMYPVVLDVLLRRDISVAYDVTPRRGLEVDLVLAVGVILSCTSDRRTSLWRVRLLSVSILRRA